MKSNNFPTLTKRMDTAQKAAVITLCNATLFSCSADPVCYLLLLGNFKKLGNGLADAFPPFSPNTPKEKRDRVTAR